MQAPKAGKIYLIGAGPGNPELLTLRAVDCLSRCDVVLYDYLANPKSLRHTAPTAECICLGKHGRSRVWSQEEIDTALVEFASQGKNVAHLKGGDPMIFGRAVSELRAAKRAGIEVEIVPGISAAVAAASFAGIPITHRDNASAVAFLTGHEMAGRSESHLDFSALAAFPGTLVVYMGVTTASEWSERLIAAGKPAKTPVAIVRRCSLPDQRVVLTTLTEVASELVPEKMRPPAIIIIGEVANWSQDYNWFAKRPLFGKTVLITRPADQTDGLRRPLEELGATVLSQPTISISPPHDWADVDATIAQLGEFQWIVFASRNGVEHFLDRLWQLGHDHRKLGELKIACVGPATSKSLEERGLRADLIPEAQRAENLAEALLETNLAGKILLIRGSRGRNTLAEMLQDSGHAVSQITAYQSSDLTQLDAEMEETWAGAPPDWVTVTSSAIARSTVNLFGDRLRHTKLASISPITTESLRELGFEPAVEAKEYTMSGVVEAILAVERKNHPT